MRERSDDQGSSSESQHPMPAAQLLLCRAVHCTSGVQYSGWQVNPRLHVQELLDRNLVAIA